MTIRKSVSGMISDKLDGVFPIGEPFSLAPLYIFRDQHGFFLGDAGQQCDEKFAFAVHGIDIFLFKEHLYIGGFQLANGVQGVHGIPGEPEDGFGHNQINVSGQCIGDHPVECLPAVDGGAGNTLVHIDTYENPAWPLADQLGEIVLLGR